MKTIFFMFLMMILSSCKSTPESPDKKETWDSGANRKQSFQEEGMTERDATTKDQFPEVMPATNQSPSK